MDISLKTATDLAPDDQHSYECHHNEYRSNNNPIKVQDEQFESSFSRHGSAEKVIGKAFANENNENEISRIELNNDQTYD